MNNWLTPLLYVTCARSCVKTLFKTKVYQLQHAYKGKHTTEKCVKGAYFIAN